MEIEKEGPPKVAYDAVTLIASLGLNQLVGLDARLGFYDPAAPTPWVSVIESTGKRA